jgi:hypothetical protein
MRRRTLLVALAGLIVLVAVGVVVWPRSSSPITQENYDRIRDGMSRAEVEAILGPPCDYSTGPLVWANRPLAVYPFAPVTPIGYGDNRVETLHWRGDRQLIIVSFDPSGRVYALGMPDVARVNQTAFENVVWRAKRQWHRWFSE